MIARLHVRLAAVEASIRRRELRGLDTRDLRAAHARIRRVLDRITRRAAA